MAREGEKCEKQAAFLLTPPSLSLAPSLQDAECESRRRREAGGGQGEQQYGGEASSRDG